LTLQRALDYQREVIGDKTCGYGGDAGVTGSSGKMPDFLSTTSNAGEARKLVIAKLNRTRDNYFAYVNESTGEVRLYAVPGMQDPLGIKTPLPDFASVALGTYGGLSSGSTRVAIKVMFSKS
jgi:hypothetical protein